MTFIKESVFEQALLHDQMDGLQGLNILKRLT